MQVVSKDRFWLCFDIFKKNGENIKTSNCYYWKETLSKVYKNNPQQALTEASQNNRLVVSSSIVLPNRNLLIK